jgi:hypothetical protein
VTANIADHGDAQIRRALFDIDALATWFRWCDNPKNLAKVDLWTSPPLCRFSTPLWRSLVDFG